MNAKQFAKHVMAGTTLLWTLACTSQGLPPRGDESVPEAMLTEATAPLPSPPPSPRAAKPKVGAPGNPGIAMADPLYFALEVKRGGTLVAKPKLLGEVDKTLRAERRPPGATQPDYQLQIETHPSGNAYRLIVDLALPGAQGHAEVLMGHGEVRQVELGETKGALQLSITLMKVDSPEFRTLMHLPEQSETRTNPRSI